jgi:serine/threonine protein kinase
LSEEFVYKHLRLHEDISVDYDTMYTTSREAVIMEQLTHSPRIVNIHGFCSTSIMSEAMGSEVWHAIVPGTGHATQAELDELDNVYPRNSYTATEKLSTALEMAEALADMHGYQGGVIIHGDTHPKQWLKSRDGTLKLNDFNIGDVLDWDPKHQRYCKASRGLLSGIVSDASCNKLLSK